jgi:hypothetical protein
VNKNQVRNAIEFGIKIDKSPHLSDEDKEKAIDGLAELMGSYTLRRKCLVSENECKDFDSFFIWVDAPHGIEFWSQINSALRQ